MKKIVSMVLLCICLIYGMYLLHSHTSTSSSQKISKSTSSSQKKSDSTSPSKKSNSQAESNPSNNQISLEPTTINNSFEDNVLKLFEKDYKIVKVSFPKGSNPSKQIQKALNLAKDSKTSIKVIIPKGKYTLKDTLHIYSNTWLYTDPDTILRKSDKHDDIMLINGEFNATYKKYGGNSNIIVDGGVWDARGESSKQRTPSVFGFAHGENIIIQHTNVKNVYAGHAVDSSGNKNIIIRDNNFLGSRNGNEYTEAIQIDGMVSDLAFRRFGSVDLTVTTNMVVDNNYFGNSNEKGMKAWGVGIGSHSAALNKPYSNIQIFNNTFERMTYAAIRGHNWENIMITGNYFYDCVLGIQIDSSGKYYYLNNGEHHQGYGNLLVSEYEIKENHFLGKEGSSIKLDGKSEDFEGHIYSADNSFYTLNLSH
ncbi:glycosyl hydrolase family 28-related protein [Bacillus sp. USDA818B3_A]|uniref:glycosyl hydrolase family 28-related protein n=1 Tax=Bacillus sp. USDA818B3_A TaxID=2698834 RepID=UPI00136D1F70|nr:glycosyl hydrolase family 28-related protein [Bacillus sp. USDA818B3_A]